jgi:hypothetical protein
MEDRGGVDRDDVLVIENIEAFDAHGFAVLSRKNGICLSSHKTARGLESSCGLKI